MYQTIESIQVQNVTSLGYCIPLFVHFPNTNVEIFLSYSAQRHLISSSSSFFSTAFSVFNLLFRASSIRFSARSFSASVISDSALRLPRLSTRPSMPFSLYFLTQKQICWQLTPNRSTAAAQSFPCSMQQLIISIRSSHVVVRTFYRSLRGFLLR